MRNVRLGLVQFNSTVGDIAGENPARTPRSKAPSPPPANAVARSSPSPSLPSPVTHRRTVLRRAFCVASRDAVERLAPATVGIIAIIGFVDWRDGDAHNAAALLADGCWVDTYHKRRLPNYGVFDEERYFSAGRRTPALPHDGPGPHHLRHQHLRRHLVPGTAPATQALAGAELCNQHQWLALPRGKRRFRERMLATRAADNAVILGYINLVGGQDELVFDGNSWFSTRTASSWRTATPSKKTCWSPTSTSKRCREPACTAPCGAPKLATARCANVEVIDVSRGSTTASKPREARRGAADGRRGGGVPRAGARHCATTFTRTASRR